MPKPRKKYENYEAIENSISSFFERELVADYKIRNARSELPNLFPRVKKHYLISDKFAKTKKLIDKYYKEVDFNTLQKCESNIGKFDGDHSEDTKKVQDFKKLVPQKLSSNATQEERDAEYRALRDPNRKPRYYQNYNGSSLSYSQLFKSDVLNYTEFFMGVYTDQINITEKEVKATKPLAFELGNMKGKLLSLYEKYNSAYDKYDENKNDNKIKEEVENFEKEIEELEEQISSKMTTLKNATADIDKKYEQLDSISKSKELPKSFIKGVEEYKNTREAMCALIGQYNQIAPARNTVQEKAATKNEFKASDTKVELVYKKDSSKLGEEDMSMLSEAASDYLSTKDEYEIFNDYTKALEAEREAELRVKECNSFVNATKQTSDWYSSGLNEIKARENGVKLNSRDLINAYSKINTYMRGTAQLFLNKPYDFKNDGVTDTLADFIGITQGINKYVNSLEKPSQVDKKDRSAYTKAYNDFVELKNSVNDYMKKNIAGEKNFSNEILELITNPKTCDKELDLAKINRLYDSINKIDIGGVKQQRYEKDRRTLMEALDELKGDNKKNFINSLKTKTAELREKEKNHRSQYNVVKEQMDKYHFSSKLDNYIMECNNYNKKNWFMKIFTSTSKMNSLKSELSKEGRVNDALLDIIYEGSSIKQKRLDNLMSKVEITEENKEVVNKIHSNITFENATFHGLTNHMNRKVENQRESEQNQREKDRNQIEKIIEYSKHNIGDRVHSDIDNPNNMQIHETGNDNTQQKNNQKEQIVSGNN